MPNSLDHYSLNDGDEDLVDGLNDVLTTLAEEVFADLDSVITLVIEADDVLKTKGFCLDKNDLDKLEEEIEDVSPGDLGEVVFPVLSEVSQEQTEYNLIVRYGCEEDSDGELEYTVDLEIAYVWETQELLDEILASGLDEGDR